MSINSIELSNHKSINDEKEIERLSMTELDEILNSFPVNLTHSKEENYTSDLVLDFQNCEILNDDLFKEMLPYLSSISTEGSAFDDLLLPSSLPKITTIDEFDAFLHDFTVNLSSSKHELSSSLT